MLTIHFELVQWILANPNSSNLNSRNDCSIREFLETSVCSIKIFELGSVYVLIIINGFTTPNKLTNLNRLLST